MKLLSLLVPILLLSCSIEEEIKNASNQCEKKVRKVFEEFEERFGYICLTEEEIMDFIEENTVEEDEDIQSARMTLKITPYFTPTKNKSYGVYDPVLKMCKSLTDY